MDTRSTTKEELRSTFERARERGSGAEVRAAAVAYYRHRAAEGATQGVAATELGLKQSTLSKWHQRGPLPRAVASSAALLSERDEVELATLRAEIEGLGPKSPSRRFPEQLKARLAGWARARRAAGIATAEIEQRLGIPWTSLAKWMAPSVRAPPSPKLRPVQVATAGEGAQPILRTAGGYIVEGLDIEGLALLLRRLG